MSGRTDRYPPRRSLQQHARPTHIYTYPPSSTFITRAPRPATPEPARIRHVPCLLRLNTVHSHLSPAVRRAPSPEALYFYRRDDARQVNLFVPNGLRRIGEGARLPRRRPCCPRNAKEPGDVGRSARDGFVAATCAGCRKGCCFRTPGSTFGAFSCSSRVSLIESSLVVSVCSHLRLVLIRESAT